MSRAAVGLRAHSGWAAAVTLGGEATAPVLLDRRRLALADDATPRPVQPYHASEGLPLAKAERIVGHAIEEARRFGERDLRALAGDLLVSRRRDRLLCRSLGLRSSSSRARGRARLARAHPRGRRGDVPRGPETRGQASRHSRPRGEGKGAVPCGRRGPRDFRDEAESPAAALGRAAGPPWAEDQKLAALAAWIALASGNKRGRHGHP